MTTLIFATAPFVRMVATKIEALYRRFLHALDDFAEAKMRQAVPEWQLRRAQREINRCRRLMHADHKKTVGAAQAGR